MVWTINQRVFITSSHRTLLIFPVNMGSLSGIRARDPLLQSLERWGLKAAQLPGVNGALEEETGRLDLGVIGSHGKSREVGSDLWWFLGFHPWKMVGSWMFWMEILGGSSHGSLNVVNHGDRKFPIPGILSCISGWTNPSYKPLTKWDDPPGIDCLKVGSSQIWWFRNV